MASPPTSSRTRWRVSSTCCGRSAGSPAPRRGAARGNAAPAPCWSTASRSAPVSSRSRRYRARAPPAAALHERGRGPVRHLHSRHDPHGALAWPRAHPRRDQDHARGEPLPVHRVPRDLPRGAQVAGRRMRTAISSLDLRRPASLGEAPGTLPDEARAPPGGATDLYVALNFGTLETSRFLDLWALHELRGISLD